MTNSIRLTKFLERIADLDDVELLNAFVPEVLAYGSWEQIHTACHKVKLYGIISTAGTPVVLAASWRCQAERKQTASRHYRDGRAEMAKIPEAVLFLIDSDDDGYPSLFIRTGDSTHRVRLAPSDIGVINKIHFDHLHWKRLQDDPSNTFAGRNAP